MVATKPKEQEIASAYSSALKHAERRAPRPFELTETARDAATDAVMWALRAWQSGRGASFETFTMSAVRRFVDRAIKQSANRFHSRPVISELTEGIAARDVQAGSFPLSLAVQELPDDLRHTVRLFHVDKFDLRDIGHLMGCSMETARTRLAKAARLLGDGAPRPRRMTGEKRFKR